MSPGVMPIMSEPTSSLAEGIGPAPAQGPGAEERLPCRRSPFVRILVRPSFQSHKAFVQEVARKSIVLVVHRAFEPGDLLAIQLQTSHAGFSGILTAKVQRAIHQDEGSWLLECSLSRFLTDDEIACMV